MAVDPATGAIIPDGNPFASPQVVSQTPAIAPGLAVTAGGPMAGNPWFARIQQMFQQMPAFQQAMQQLQMHNPQAFAQLGQSPMGQLFQPMGQPAAPVVQQPAAPVAPVAPVGGPMRGNDPTKPGGGYFSGFAASMGDNARPWNIPTQARQPGAAGGLGY